MADTDPPRTPPSTPDGDGVRAIPKTRDGRRSAPGWVLAAVLVAGAGLWAWWPAPQEPAVQAPAATASAPAPAAAAPLTPATRPGAGTLVAMTNEPRNGDPDDLANYFRPGDPEPTGAELIDALHQVGVRTGIGAFNPPGTSPPLQGLAVPDDFELPRGYVRHHQSTDGGATIEPILMFAPGFTLFDRDGRPIAMPEDRVVPPGLAPPGMPLRRVRIPPG